MVMRFIGGPIALLVTERGSPEPQRPRQTHTLRLWRAARRFHGLDTPMSLFGKALHEPPHSEGRVPRGPHIKSVGLAKLVPPRFRVALRSACARNNSGRRG